VLVQALGVVVAPNPEEPVPGTRPRVDAAGPGGVTFGGMSSPYPSPVNQIAAARNALKRGGVLLLVAKALRYLSDRVVMVGAKRALERRRAETRTIEDAVETAFGFEDWDVVIAPMQVRSEIESLLRLLDDDAPGVVLELGTARGGTLFLLCHVARDDATLISVDLPGGEFGGGYSAALAPLLASFATKQQCVELIRGDSHSEETSARVTQLLAGSEVDFLLIDGDHTYKGVRRDFETYTPLVRRDGWIALHDIVPGRPDLVGGVPEFWSELKAARPVRELVEDWNQGAYGIGLIQKATEPGTAA
jgi:predicted O-methyltransferase YrrM